MHASIRHQMSARSHLPFHLLALLVLTAVLAAACGGPEGGANTPDEDPAEATAAGGEESAGVRSYTVAGVVRQLPDREDPSKQLLIHHAPIPDYVNADGYETGMPAMTMPFFPAPGVDLAGLAVGDRVEFTFRVDRSATPAIRLTAIARATEPDGGAS